MVRLELSQRVSQAFQSRLSALVKVETHQIYIDSCPLNMKYVFRLVGDLPAETAARLLYRPYAGRWPEDISRERGLLSQLQKQDKLLFYPYDSMDAFLAVLQEAAHDPAVTSIKITIYRLASESRVAQRLIEAAENGKEVTVLMELRARFDEANNIEWSERLEESGCTIVYGLENFKCHSKICLITKQVDGKTTNYTQIGTGNYNEKTARLYTDLCLFTANETIGKDAVSFFQNMLIGNLNGAYTGLLVAPANMK